jgi:hypothetical protein
LIYLDGRPRPPENVHLELGAARGHWEGDTLIVEYTNFSNEEGAGKEHLTARYKRLDDNHLLFGFTRDDPGTRTKPYSIEFVMWRLTGILSEMGPNRLAIATDATTRAIFLRCIVMPPRT